MRPCKGADWRDRHIKQYKAREKVTQKMTREGAVEVNAATGKKKRISKRIRDADFAKTEAPPQPEQAAQPLPGGATSPPLTDTPPLPHAPGAEREQDTAAAERVLERIDGARTRKASKKAARKAQAEATAKEKSSRLQRQGSGAGNRETNRAAQRERQYRRACAFPCRGTSWRRGRVLLF